MRRARPAASVFFSALLATALLLGAASAALAVCGDTILEMGEQCEAPFGLCCDSGTCLYRSTASVCRTGSGDSCDPDETCTGASDVCPSDVVEPAGTVCRAGGDPICDPDELCSGVSLASCPVDAVAGGGTPCDDSAYCTVSDTCDGTGICNGPLRDCTDVDPCTADSCDEGANTCINDGSCNDGNLCTTDYCEAGVGCHHDGAAPATGCLVAARSTLRMRDDEFIDYKDFFRWKWRKGPAVSLAELGDPLTTTTYSLCVYDYIASVPTYVLGMGVPPDSEQWVIRHARAKYYEDTGFYDGTNKVEARSEVAGKTTAQWKASGFDLDFPLPFDGLSQFDASPHVLVQMLTSDGGVCWESTFAAADAKQNYPGVFKAKSE